MPRKWILENMEVYFVPTASFPRKGMERRDQLITITSSNKQHAYSEVLGNKYIIDRRNGNVREIGEEGYVGCCYASIEAANNEMNKWIEFESCIV